MGAVSTLSSASMQMVPNPPELDAAEDTVPDAAEDELAAAAELDALAEATLLAAAVALDGVMHFPSRHCCVRSVQSAVLLQDSTQFMVSWQGMQPASSPTEIATASRLDCATTP